MSKYKSFSIHQTIYKCRQAIAAVAAGITAAALPLAVLGVGAVGAAIFKVSQFSANMMLPTSATQSEIIVPQESQSVSSDDIVSSEDESSKKASGGNDADTSSTEAEDTVSSEEAKNTNSNRGKVKEVQIKNSGVNYGNVYVKDGNSNYDANIKQLLASSAKCKIKKNAGYQVLLVHTHTTEGYADSDKDWYSKSYNPRTTDKSESVVAVADEIEKQLNAAGIKTLHVTTYHDYPEYTGAYNRARETIKSYLKKYPSIEMVIDVHRDSMTQDDGTKLKPTVTIDGKKAAQVMIISGCDNDGKLNFSGWRDNLIIAAQLQKQMATDYKGLARPLYFAPFRYNMDLTPNSLLIEFGTDVNTLEEATYSGKMVGKSLVKVLEKYVVN